MTIIVRVAKKYPNYEVERINAYDEEALEKVETISRNLHNKLENKEIEDFLIEMA